MSNLPLKPLEGEELNPNDPKVYTDPNMISLLDPREQMIAFINLAQTGQLVQGNPTLTIEYMLEGAGYNMVPDGQLSGDELAALEDFKRKLNDDGFKETALQFFKDFAHVEGDEKFQLFSKELLSTLFEPEKAEASKGGPGGVKKALKFGMIADPD